MRNWWIHFISTIRRPLLCSEKRQFLAVPHAVILATGETSLLLWNECYSLIQLWEWRSSPLSLGVLLVSCLLNSSPGLLSRTPQNSIGIITCRHIRRHPPPHYPTEAKLCNFGVHWGAIPQSLLDWIVKRAALFLWAGCSKTYTVLWNTDGICHRSSSTPMCSFNWQYETYNSLISLKYQQT